MGCVYWGTFKVKKWADIWCNSYLKHWLWCLKEWCHCYQDRLLSSSINKSYSIKTQPLPKIFQLLYCLFTLFVHKWRNHHHQLFLCAKCNQKNLFWKCYERSSLSWAFSINTCVQKQNLLFAPWHFGFLFRNQSSLNPQFCKEILQVLEVNNQGDSLGL